MTRPRLTFLLPLAVALLAGCSGFTDSDAVARYDGVELGSDQLTELMEVLSPPDVTSDPTNANAARETISLFMRIEAVKDRLAQDGTEVTPQLIADAETQLSSVVPGFDELSQEMRDYLTEAQAAFVAFSDVSPPTEDELRTLYEKGPAGSGVTCASHILVATEDEANEVVSELAAGGDFSTLAGQRSLDTGSGAQGGALPCVATDALTTSYVLPFAEAALAAEIGVATAPVESEFGFHVIRLRAFDEARAELDAFFSPQEFAISRTIERADVYVDSRYGTLAGGIVVPLS